MAKVVAMILAGGKGTRLYPLTKHRSKPAVPIAGKFRLIDIPISNCIHSGYRRIYIITQFSAESLHRHILLTYRFSNFSKDFVTILSAQQTLENREWYQGTADAVRQNLAFLQDYGEYVLILSGDHLYQMDYSKFVEYHVQQDADITIGVIPVNREAATQFGVMKIDPDTRINTFHEKPTDPAVLDELIVPQEAFETHRMEARDRTHLASMGIYVFKKSVLIKLLEGTEYQDFGKEVIPQAIKNYRVYAYFFDGYWEDIGTIKAFFKAQLDLTAHLPKFNFYDEERPIFSHPRFLPAAKVLDAEIRNTLLCDGVIVNPSTIENAIIGIRTIIGLRCKLSNVVIMGGDFFETPEDKERNRITNVPDIGIGENCEIEYAIIDKNARIGNNVKITRHSGDDYQNKPNYVIKDGITVIPKNAIIPDNTII